jgi:ABC-type uncharacterized transport system ATPase subunit
MELQIERVGKRYSGDKWALRQFSLKLGPGILGLLGPNGAGKTTLMSIIATITRPTEGTLYWNGIELAKNPNAIRTVLGYLPQDFGVYPNLNAVEFLEYLAAVKGLDPAAARRRIEEPLDLVNLSDVRKRPLGLWRAHGAGAGRAVAVDVPVRRCRQSLVGTRAVVAGECPDEQSSITSNKQQGRMWKELA